MKSKKAVVGIWWIVTAVIAVVVLVLLLVFLSTGVGGGIAQLLGLKEQVTAGTDLTMAQSTCTNLCTQARVATLRDEDQWAATQYCVRSFNIDLNNDGTIDSDEQNIHCDESPINVPCDATLEDGSAVNEINCTL